MHPEVKRRKRDGGGEGYIGDEGKMRDDKMQQHKCESQQQEHSMSNECNTFTQMHHTKLIMWDIKFGTNS